MCTAATYYSNNNFYMGRTLDYERTFGEGVCVTPRAFPLDFRHEGRLARHYALIGTAHVAQGYPLYYDAVNEKGLGMAGLNFVESCRYGALQSGARNIAQFELIPWLLGRCASLAEARRELAALTVVGENFSAELPAARLHWLIADKSGVLVLECTQDGQRIYENPAGVLTNEPPFGVQLFMLRNYLTLSPQQPECAFARGLSLTPYSRGMGAMGLPGDYSSASRFVRAAFVRGNAVSGDSEAESVGQFFHITDAVSQPRGVCAVGDSFEVTQYACCWNARSGVYYYTTYNNRRITAVDMHRADLDGARLECFPQLTGEDILRQN